MMGTSPVLTPRHPETNISHTRDTPAKNTNPVTRGSHRISHAAPLKRLIVTARQLRSLTGTYQVKPKTIPCKLPQYGNKFPEQTSPSGNFHGVCNGTDNLVENLYKSATVSKTVFNPEGSPDKPVKAGHQSTGFRHRWNDLKVKISQDNRRIADSKRQNFNGKQLCVYFSIPEIANEQTAETGLKLIPSDYFSQAIVRRSQPTGSASANSGTSTVHRFLSSIARFCRCISNDASTASANNDDISTARSAYNCGAINVVVTTDDKIVFGHRNKKPMFPAGFILGDQTQQTDESIAPILNEIGKSTTFADLARDTALKERKEEVYDDNGEWKTEVETVGAIGKVFCWPSKKAHRNYRKPVFIIKSTVFMERIPVSSEKLKTLREEKGAKDGHELGALHFLSKDDLKDTTKGKTFIAEHAKCFEMLAPFFTGKVTEKSK